MHSCGESLIGMLTDRGIEVAFGIPGVHTIELYRGLSKSSIHHVTVRHEQGAGFMADGYARVTGRPAACITVSGPGAFNIATAMGQALRDSVPMLVISADNAGTERGLGLGRLHETRNLQAAMAECSAWSHTLRDPTHLPQVLARTFAVFHGERPGPVHLTIPLDVMAAPMDGAPEEPWTLPGPPAPEPDSIARAAALLQDSKTPVVALGGGCVDAWQEARQLAEVLDAPVTLTHNAKGILPPDHPLLVACSPSYTPARDLYREADVILGVGTEFAETDYDFLLDGGFDSLFDGDGELVRIDIDGAQLSRNVFPKVAIRSDAALALHALLEELKPVRRDGIERTRLANAQCTQMHDADYQAFLDCLQRALPGAVLICDSTQPAYAAASQYHAPAPRCFASAATGYGTLGYALPAACGARLGRPDLPVIALIGDGGAQFTLNELASAVEAELPIAVVLWNNHGYKEIAKSFKAAGMEPMACDIHTPDFLAIARAYGCQAHRARTLAELEGYLGDSRHHTVPTIIEVLEQDFLKT